MDITQLNYFISVAQTLNFTEAARRNGVSQPAISKRMAELEKSLDCQLFLRNRKSVSLTQSGVEFLPYALEMVELAEKAAFQVQKTKAGAEGHLSISALTTSSAILSKCLATFSRRYPGIFVDITFTSGRSQVMALNQDKFDLHFAVSDMVPQGESFEFVPTHIDQLCLALPKDHPLADKPLDFDALHGERFIAVSETDGSVLYESIMKVCKARGYQPNITGQYDRAEAVLLSVSAGLGISIIPQALSKVFYSENVTFIPIPGDDAYRTYVLARKKPILNPAVDMFWNTVLPILPID